MSGYRTCKNSKVGRRNSRRAPGCAAADEDSHDRMTQAYIRDVAKRFKHQPSVYRQFVHILSDTKTPAVDKIDIITRVAILFHDHRDLILRFNRFLPPGYAFEIQDDAVVVKVLDSLGAVSVDAPRRGEFWLAEGRNTVSRDSRRVTQTTLKTAQQKGIRETLKYVAKVKEASTTRVYRQFLDALADFHEHRIGELETIQRIVALFQMRASLVEGFNRFLPDGFAVRKEGESGYMITYPHGASNRPETLHYMIDEAFTR